MSKKNFQPPPLSRCDKEERQRGMSVCSDSRSPRTHLHVVGMLRFMSDINQPSLPTPFIYLFISLSFSLSLCLSLSVSFCLSLLFLCLFLPLLPFQLFFIPYILPTTLPFPILFFRSYLCRILPRVSTVYLSMKVSSSPDVIPSG